MRIGNSIVVVCSPAGHPAWRGGGRDGGRSPGTRGRCDMEHVVMSELQRFRCTSCRKKLAGYPGAVGVCRRCHSEQICPGDDDLIHPEAGRVHAPPEPQPVVHHPLAG